jgi:hypothetical protein
LARDGVRGFFFGNFGDFFTHIYSLIGSPDKIIIFTSTPDEIREKLLEIWPDK